MDKKNKTMKVVAPIALSLAMVAGMMPIKADEAQPTNEITGQTNQTGQQDEIQTPEGEKNPEEETKPTGTEVTDPTEEKTDNVTEKTETTEEKKEEQGEGDPKPLVPATPLTPATPTEGNSSDKTGDFYKITYDENRTITIHIENICVHEWNEWSIPMVGGAGRWYVEDSWKSVTLHDVVVDEQGKITITADELAKAIEGEDAKAFTQTPLYRYTKLFGSKIWRIDWNRGNPITTLQFNLNNLLYDPSNGVYYTLSGSGQDDWWKSQHLYVYNDEDQVQPGEGEEVEESTYGLNIKITNEEKETTFNFLNDQLSDEQWSELTELYTEWVSEDGDKSEIEEKLTGFVKGLEGIPVEDDVQITFTEFTADNLTENVITFNLSLQFHRVPVEQLEDAYFYGLKGTYNEEIGLTEYLKNDFWYFMGIGTLNQEALGHYNNTNSVSDITNALNDTKFDATYMGALNEAYENTSVDRRDKTELEDGKIFEVIRLMRNNSPEAPDTSTIVWHVDGVIKDDPNTELGYWVNFHYGKNNGIEKLYSGFGLEGNASAIGLSIIPSAEDVALKESNLVFKGWTMNGTTGKVYTNTELVDMEVKENMEFYAVYGEPEEEKETIDLYVRHEYYLNDMSSKPQIVINDDSTTAYGDIFAKINTTRNENESKDEFYERVTTAFYEKYLGRYNEVQRLIPTDNGYKYNFMSAEIVNLISEDSEVEQTNESSGLYLVIKYLRYETIEGSYQIQVNHHYFDSEGEEIGSKLAQTSDKFEPIYDKYPYDRVIYNETNIYNVLANMASEVSSTTYDGKNYTLSGDKTQITEIDDHNIIYLNLYYQLVETKPDPEPTPDPNPGRDDDNDDDDDDKENDVEIEDNIPPLEGGDKEEETINELETPETGGEETIDDDATPEAGNKDNVPNTGVKSTLPWVAAFIVSCATIIAELLKRRKAQ